MAETKQQTTAATQPQAIEAGDFSSLLRKEFKPKTDEAREAVEQAVKTLAQQALSETKLISPDVVPFIRDQAKLADYMDQRRVDYLVAFPYWYPDLVQRGIPVFASGGQFVPQTGNENMVIYTWKSP